MCFSCVNEVTQRLAEKQTAIAEAKKFANTEKTTVAVYYEAGSWKYIKAEIAQAEGTPATIFISPDAT